MDLHERHYMFRLKLAITKSRADIFLVINTLNITNLKYHIHLITRL